MEQRALSGLNFYTEIWFSDFSERRREYCLISVKHILFGVWKISIGSILQSQNFQKFNLFPSTDEKVVRYLLSLIVVM